MEYTQWETLSCKCSAQRLSLNPCCNGIYSMSALVSRETLSCKVLILVVMEYTQWDYSFY